MSDENTTVTPAKPVSQTRVTLIALATSVLAILTDRYALPTTPPPTPQPTTPVVLPEVYREYAEIAENLSAFMLDIRTMLQQHIESPAPAVNVMVPRYPEATEIAKDLAYELKGLAPVYTAQPAQVTASVPPTTRVELEAQRVQSAAEREQQRIEAIIGLGVRP